MIVDIVFDIGYDGAGGGIGDDFVSKVLYSNVSVGNFDKNRVQFYIQEGFYTLVYAEYTITVYAAAKDVPSLRNLFVTEVIA